MSLNNLLPVGYIEFNDRLILTSISPNTEAILGWNLRYDRRLPLNIYWLVHEKDWDRLNTALDNIVKGKPQKTVFKLRNITYDLHVVWCEWYISVIKDDNNLKFQTLLKRISPSKAIRSKLKVYDKISCVVPNTVCIGNWQIDWVNKSQIWSNQMYQIFGIAPERPATIELFLSFVLADDLKSCKEIFEKQEDSALDFKIVLGSTNVKHLTSFWRFEYNDDKVLQRSYGVFLWIEKWL